MTTKQKDQIYSKMTELGINELLTNKSHGYGITLIDELYFYTQYFEDMNPIKDTPRFYWCISNLKSKINNDRHARVIKSVLDERLKLKQSNTIINL